MVIDLGFARVLVYMLAVVRLLGMLMFNPIFSRTNIPGMVRVGLVILLSILLVPFQPESVFENVYAMSMVGYIFAIIRELFIGLIYGYVFQIFFYLLYFVGDQIDTDIGISMAKTFDPMTSIQTGFSSSVITILFVLYIFSTGSHYTLFYYFGDSFKAIPLGSIGLNTDILSFCIRLFSRMFSFVVRLAAPIIVAEFILQFSMGILMKFIPQITIFVINFQLRILLGILLLYLLAPYIGQFMNNYIETMFESILEAVGMLAAGASSG